MRLILYWSMLISSLFSIPSFSGTTRACLLSRLKEQKLRTTISGILNKNSLKKNFSKIENLERKFVIHYKELVSKDLAGQQKQKQLRAFAKEFNEEMNKLLEGLGEDEILTLMDKWVRRINMKHGYLPGLKSEENATNAGDLILDLVKKEERFFSKVFGNLLSSKTYFVNVSELMPPNAQGVSLLESQNLVMKTIGLEIFNRFLLLAEQGKLQSYGISGLNLKHYSDLQQKTMNNIEFLRSQLSE